MASSQLFSPDVLDALAKTLFQRMNAAAVAGSKERSVVPTSGVSFTPQTASGGVSSAPNTLLTPDFLASLDCVHNDSALSRSDSLSQYNSF